MDKTAPYYRWHATIDYRAGAGTINVEHDLEELVERGPHWDTIEIIVIRINHVTDSALTVERATTL